jgi:hypothetical protein
MVELRIPGWKIPLLVSFVGRVRPNHIAKARVASICSRLVSQVTGTDIQGNSADDAGIYNHGSVNVESTQTVNNRPASGGNASRRLARPDPRPAGGTMSWTDNPGGAAATSAPRPQPTPIMSSPPASYCRRPRVTRACPVDHETGWRSQILIEATSTVPRQTKSRLSYRVATARCWRSWQNARSTVLRCL